MPAKYLSDILNEDGTFASGADSFHAEDYIKICEDNDNRSKIDTKKYECKIPIGTRWRIRMAMKFFK